MQQLLHLDRLRELFEVTQSKSGEDPKYYWTLYKGQKSSEKSNFLFDNRQVAELEPSWELLLKLLELHAPVSSVFTVMLKNAPTSNGVPLTYINTPEGSIKSTSSYGYGYYQGISGMPMMPGTPPFMAGLEQVSQLQVQLVEERWRNKYEKLEEQLEAMQEEKVGTIDKILDRIDLDKHLPMLLGLLKRPQPAIGEMQGALPAAPAAPSPEPAQGPGIDFNTLVQAAQEASMVFERPDQVFLLLARWARQNPEMAKNLITQIAPTQ